MSALTYVMIAQIMLDLSVRLHLKCDTNDVIVFVLYVNIDDYGCDNRPVIPRARPGQDFFKTAENALC